MTPDEILGAIEALGRQIAETGLLSMIEEQRAPRWYGTAGRDDDPDEKLWRGYLIGRRYGRRTPNGRLDLELRAELSRRHNFGWGLSYRRSEWSAQVNANAGRIGSGWFTLNGVLPHLHDRVGDYEGRHVTLNVRLHDDEVERRGLVSWAFWVHEHSWTRGRYPAWREGRWSAHDWLIGRWTHVADYPVAHRPAAVSMPEDAPPAGAEYPATVDVELTEWRRTPRFGLGRLVPTTQHRLSARVTLEHGIPFPGKGENSWDCGDDAIFGTGASLPSVFDRSADEIRIEEDTITHLIGEAVANAAKAARRNRERYRGAGWRVTPGMVETAPDGRVTKVTLR